MFFKLGLGLCRRVFNITDEMQKVCHHLDGVLTLQTSYCDIDHAAEGAFPLRFRLAQHVHAEENETAESESKLSVRDEDEIGG